MLPFLGGGRGGGVVKVLMQLFPCGNGSSFGNLRAHIIDKSNITDPCVNTSASSECCHPRKM